MTITEYRDLDQGTPEWFEARRGLLTASTIGTLIDSSPPSALDYGCPQCNAEPGEQCWSRAKKEPAPIKTPHSPRAAVAAENPDNLPERLTVADTDASRKLTARLVAERITGWVDETYTSRDMERGHIAEPYARNAYTEHTGKPVDELGFMVRTLDSGARIGWSPDGLVGDEESVEIKAPRAETHLLTILADEVPAQHIPQCQTALFVSGRKHLDFISFYGGLKPFIKRVHADPTWFAVIEAAAHHFETKAAEMADAYKNATAGLPSTDRLPDPYDMEITI